LEFFRVALRLSMDRRTFMQYSSSLSIFGVFQHPLFKENQSFEIASSTKLSIEELEASGYFVEDFGDPSNEKAWAKIQALFPRVTSFCQLENGYFSHASLPIRAFHQEREDYIQSRTSYFMRREQEASVERSRKDLASFFSWIPENLAFTRNTTESLNILISGFPWQKGDEVVIGDQDYGSMNEAFYQAVLRHGIVLKTAKIPLVPQNEQEVIGAYMQLLTPKTKILHLTHLINLSGQIIPLTRIIQEARKRNPEVCIAVDAAHSVAHFEYDWKNCGADIVAGSLHKWMCNPIGLGFLYLSTPWIPKLWPLMGDQDRGQTDIRRFEHQGTRPIATIETIGKALALNTLIGGVKNREQRLRYLQESWTKEIQTMSRFQINTPNYPGASCAIANVSMQGKTASELATALWDGYQIFTVAIEHPVVKGVRITPHLSNSIDDIQKLVKALKELAS